MKKAHASDVLIRKFTPAEILPLVNYWTESSEEFWRLRGIDKAKLPSKEQFIAAYDKTFAEEGEIKKFAVIFYHGSAIGVHTLTDIIENESAIFHAHIWDGKSRGQGVAVFSYLKAVEFFMNSYGFKKIIFKTPKINSAANRIKEKIGIPCLGDTVFETPIMIAPMAANLYEMDCRMLNQLKQKHGL